MDYRIPGTSVCKLHWHYIRPSISELPQNVQSQEDIFLHVKPCNTIRIFTFSAKKN